MLNGHTLELLAAFHVRNSDMSPFMNYLLITSFGYLTYLGYTKYSFNRPGHLEYFSTDFVLSVAVDADLILFRRILIGFVMFHSFNSLPAHVDDSLQELWIVSALCCINR